MFKRRSAALQEQETVSGQRRWRELCTSKAVLGTATSSRQPLCKASGQVSGMEVDEVAAGRGSGCGAGASAGSVAV